MKRIDYWARTILPAIFIVFIFANLFCFSIFAIKSKNFNNEVVNEYFASMEGHDSYIEIYGAVQRVLGKKQIENFTIFKNDYGKLVSPRAQLSASSVEAKFSEVETVFEYLRNKNIPYLYLGNLLPIEGINDIPIGAVDYSKDNEIKLKRILEKKQVPYFDLYKNIDLTREELFYRTDHHWSGDACFHAWLALEEWFENSGVLPTEDIYGPEEFEREVIPDCFLGSYGVKVGKYYAGKDDYVYYNPLFQPEVLFKQYDADETLVNEMSGSWVSTLMDQGILSNKNYNNKYNASLRGFAYINEIVNEQTNNSKKLLVISHSYGRPLVQYLALNFREVRQIDPQSGRFNGNLAEYIDNYRPDYVIFLVEFEGEVVGEFKVE